MSYSVTESLTKNTALMMATQLSTWISGFVLLLFLPRYLGSAAYGQLYLALSIQMIFQYVIAYGGQYQISKDVSRDREGISELMSNSAILRIGLWLLSMVVTFVLCEVASYPFDTVLIVMILGFSNYWRGLASLIRYGFQGVEEMRYPSIAAVVERTFLMFTVVPALLLGANVLIVGILTALSVYLNYLISMKFGKRLFKLELRVHLDKLKPVFRSGVPYFLWSLFGIIYYRIDAVMLSVMVPVSVVGWYGAAYRLFDILMFLPSIFSQALYPILSRQSATELDSMRYTSQKSLEFLLLASIPIAIGMIEFAKPIIALLFGLSQYAPSIGIIQIFSVGTVMVYVDFVLGGTVFALDKQRAFAFVAFAAVIVNVVSNYFLIRYFQVNFGNGGTGAAVATNITELFVLVSAIVLIPKEIFGTRFLVAALKGITSGVMMWLGIMAFGAVGLPWIAQGILGVMMYVAFLFLLSTFEPSEIMALRSALSPGKIRQYLFAKKGIDA